MADLVSYCNPDRDIEQALISLKKGAQLLKYGRKGKPKFYPFRVSNDETSLIWIANSGQKNLKLASVSRIIPGQRTAVFQRYLRPEKDYLSFSLIYNKGKRSLDLICKDKVEAEIWIAGLKALISSGLDGRSKIDGWNGGLSFDESRDLTSISGSTSSPEVSIISSTHNPEASDDVASEQTNIMQQPKPPVSDPLRFSVSSAPTSTSSHDEPDSLGDVYVWGEVPCEGNIVIPKPLECHVVIDVSRVACGARHAALLTRQGEVFTWGEDVPQPRLVEPLTSLHVDLVVCGDYHTCAVTSSGELYTWAHNAGLSGHWMPKRVMGPLEGLQVASVACGPWHTALVTSSGRLFTFGEGSFGVLGHGDRTSVLCPKEVESLSGLRTVKVACGVWHTAAIVEIIAAQSETKLFTWGDGDKNRLGQGDREARLKPTCVSSLIDHNFQKLACGHSLTVGLTVSGRVFAMGSSVYGQLGNVNSDGKLPCEVEGKLTVEEISCGAYHVAVLTSRNEVYTWGKGANGSLGHGDNEDRKVPTLVEALKDKNVKFVSCGSNYTTAVCVHKWVSGAEQMQCSTCRNAFGFTRKRHHCYNCGLVHCHTCSSKKAVRAALAPNPSKPYRVCDSCSAKLSGAHGRRNSVVFARSALPSSNLDIIRQLPSKAKKANRSIPKNVGSRPASPFSRKSSPPRSSTPVPTASGLSVSQNVTDSLRKTNELLNDELIKLRAQVRELKLQESELQKSAKKAEEAVALAEEESAKYNTAKEVIRSLTEQLKDMAEKLPPGSYDPESVKLVHLINGAHDPGSYDETNSKSDALNGFDLTSHSGTSPDASTDNGNVSNSLDHNATQIKSEWIEQYEPGVYITLVALQDGTRDLKRVRFSRRRFGEHQAEKWWSENRERVYEKYNVRGSTVSGQAAAQKSEDGFSPSLL